MPMYIISWRLLIILIFKITFPSNTWWYEDEDQDDDDADDADNDADDNDNGDSDNK